MLKRILEPFIKADLEKKIIILSGPRQCGKTTLSKSLFKTYDYFNFDNGDDRLKVLKKEWDRSQPLLILDELHKMKNWKSFLKGIYDKEGLKPKLLVTGSARMSAFKKAGDSLAGRHFNFRLHPFDLKELKKSGSKLSIEESYARLQNVGGFPEPFLSGKKNDYNRWRRSHIDLILRQDAFDLEVIRDISSLETLIHLLSERVGSTVATANLAQQISKDPKTTQKWLSLLENLFIIFKVTPYHQKISRSLKKEPKYYFYDSGLVRGDESQKLENIVACALIKEANYLEDALGYNVTMNFLKTKDGNELDFLIQIEGEKPWIIEVKLGDADISPNFKKFSPFFKNVNQIQLVKNLSREFSNEQGVKVVKALNWLSNLNLINQE
jgi:uncharacterized protein